MARVRMLRLQVPRSNSGGEQVAPISWRPLQSPAKWQEIGKYGNTSPLVNQVGMAPQLQRKSGFLGSSPRRLYPATGLPSWQQTQQVGNYQGTQRMAGVPGTQGPSRFGVAKMRSAITAQQVQQSGAGLLPFVQSMYASQQS